MTRDIKGLYQKSPSTPPLYNLEIINSHSTLGVLKKILLLCPTLFNKRGVKGDLFYIRPFPFIKHPISLRNRMLSINFSIYALNPSSFNKLTQAYII